MRFINISKILIITAIPLLIFLLAANFIAFDKSFYQRKFSEYKVNENVEGAQYLHEQVISFIQGKSSGLPNGFNERERQHLLDVKGIIKISSIALYIFIAVFIILLVASAFILKVNNYIINFVGKVLLFGGILTIMLAAILFFMISFGFSATFESFHKLFFEKGTYVFDPANEMIVNLYPEQLFMDLGLKISKRVILASALVILLGIILIFMSKSKKNKNRGKLKIR